VSEEFTSVRERVTRISYGRAVTIALVRRSDETELRSADDGIDKITRTVREYTNKPFHV